MRKRVVVPLAAAFVLIGSLPTILALYGGAYCLRAIWADNVCAERGYQRASVSATLRASCVVHLPDSVITVPLSAVER